VSDDESFLGFATRVERNEGGAVEVWQWRGGLAHEKRFAAWR